MNLTIHEAAEDILSSRGFRSSAGYLQHGETSVMDHSLHVTRLSVRLAALLEVWGVKIDERALIRGALLHDYFGYDYHRGAAPGNRRPKLHGFYHPGTAARNAQRDFGLSEKERDIILRHMWPLTVVPPACREGWIVTLADKCCTVGETLAPGGHTRPAGTPPAAGT